MLQSLFFLKILWFEWNLLYKNEWDFLKKDFLTQLFEKLSFVKVGGGEGVHKIWFLKISLFTWDLSNNPVLGNETSKIHNPQKWIPYCFRTSTKIYEHFIEIAEAWDPSRNYSYFINFFFLSLKTIHPLWETQERRKNMQKYSFFM